MYRFHLPDGATGLQTLRTTWIGYGEAIAGFPVTTSVWDASASAWVPFSSAVMGNETTATTVTASPARFVDASGDTWVLAQAKKVAQANVNGAVTFTSSPGFVTASWQSYGPASGYVDYGTAPPPYTSSAGTDTLSTSHSVTFPLGDAGRYHYGIRSTDANGVTRSSPDVMFGWPPPSLTHVFSFGQSTSPATVVFSWTETDTVRAPYTYQFKINGDNGYSFTSAWQSAATTSRSLPFGNYTWQVTAKDNGGVLTPASTDAFSFTYAAPTTCPYLFTWDGTKMAFASDIYGQGKLGIKTASGYLTPDPKDYEVVDPSPVATDGVLDIRLVEERIEADYLDQFSLYTADAPVGRDVVTEMPLAGGRPYNGLPSVVHTVDPNDGPPPKVTWVNTGEDVTGLVAASDGDYLLLNQDRNAGLQYQTLELDLGDVSAAPQVKLVIDGRTMFPDSQAGLDLVRQLGGRTILQVQDDSGAWVSVPAAVCPMPKPSEFERPYVMDVTHIWRSASRKVRLTYLFKTYVDSIKLDTTADEPVLLNRVPMVSADLRARGFDPRTAGGDFYEYSYGAPTGLTQFFPGDYTKYGDVSPLLGSTDDKFVIFGGGDELAMRFAEPLPAPDGFTRRYIAYTDGYYKDFKSAVPSFTVDPLPFASMSTFPYPPMESYPTDAEHQDYLRLWNTRTEYAPNTGPSVTTQAAVSARAASTQAVPAAPAVANGPAPAAAPARPASPHRSLNTDLVMLEASYSSAVGGCQQCHAVHGAAGPDGNPYRALLPANETYTCTGNGQGGCHSSGANAAGGVNVYASITATSNPTAHHDLLPSQQTASGAKIACSDCHDPHKETAAERFSNPDSIEQTVTPDTTRYLDASRSIYVLVGAEHDGVAPAITNLAPDYSVPTAPAFTWNTNEPATTWVDWGTTASYELGSFGANLPLVTSHRASVVATPDGGVYHYRVRSADALGNEMVSADATFAAVALPSAPASITPSAYSASVYGYVIVPVAVSWTAATPGDADVVQYQVYVDGVGQGWSTATSRTLSIPTVGTMGVTVHSWYVVARDSVHTYALSPHSPSGTISIDDLTDYSCPILYAWNGSAFGFVTDVMGRGALGIQVAPGRVPLPAADRGQPHRRVAAQAEGWVVSSCA